MRSTLEREELGTAVGIVATPLQVSGFTLPFTGDPNSTVSNVLYVPMAVREMVLAASSIAFGLRRAASAAVAAA